MNLTASLSAVMAVPVMGMALAASSVAAPSGKESATHSIVAKGSGAECRENAKGMREFRACRGGRWSKAQSVYD